MHPRRYFPFAATGINITAFVVELLEEFRLNTLIFARLEEGRLQNVGGEEAVAGSGFGGDLVQAGADVLSEVYCDVFTEFEDGSGRSNYVMSGTLRRAPRLLHLAPRP